MTLSPGALIAVVLAFASWGRLTAGALLGSVLAGHACTAKHRALELLRQNSDNHFMNRTPAADTTSSQTCHPLSVKPITRKQRMPHSHVPHPDAPQGIAAPFVHAALPAFGLIVVGDELLSGRRSDRHIPKMIELLTQRGLALSYVHMLGDDRPRLVRLLQQVLASGDVVMCCGGIGATPDDHTRQAAAAAAGVELVMHPVARNLIEQRMQEQAQQKGQAFDPRHPDNVQRLQMAMLPAHAHIIPNPYNRIAGFSVGHVHFFPGFPVMAHPMIAWVLDHFYARWHNMRDWSEQALIVKNASEASLTPLMESLEARWPAIRIFSLPRVDHPVHGTHIELGVKGPKQMASDAFNALRQELLNRQIPFFAA